MGEEFCVGGERNVFVVCTEAVVQIAHLAAAEVSVCRHSASSTCWGSGLRPPPLRKVKEGRRLVCGGAALAYHCVHPPISAPSGVIVPAQGV